MERAYLPTLTRHVRFVPIADMAPPQARSVGGTARLSALAVLRWIKQLVICSGLRAILSWISSCVRCSPLPLSLVFSADNRPRDNAR